MLNTIEAVVRNGQIVPTERIELAERSRALVTILQEEEDEFWLSANEESLSAIWDNDEDDVYAELLSE